MKKFIYISNFQNPERFEAGKYIPVDNEKLEYDKEVHYPIINVINAFAEQDEEVELITVIADYDNSKVNYKTLISEVEELEKTKHIKVKKTECSIPYDNGLDTQLEMFEKLIANMEDNDRLYCDITYGTKVMSQILTMSVNYGYRVNNNVTLGCIVYGEKEHNTGAQKIYDITSLNYLDEIVRMMAENKVKEPLKRIRALLKWGDIDEN